MGGTVMKHSVIASISLTQILAASAALGQLSDADIAALKKRGETEGWTFTVGKTSATRRSHEELCGGVAQEEWRVGAPFDPCTPRGSLPASFDWRELDGCTRIRDQNVGAVSCGSCWAFATVGPLESNIRIKDGVSVDLSEQWLVSCNQEGWSCSGGRPVHEYHEDTPDPCGDYGAVLESDFPYVADDPPDALCNCPYSHRYWIDEWSYVGDGSSTPPTDSIKQAILDYGPVTTAIEVNPAFEAYSGGVFNACVPNPSLNHFVVLVGWDDSQGTNGVWLLRNSWGTDWGEDENGVSWDADGDGTQDHDGGYMRIEYGCSLLDDETCYVYYPGSMYTRWVEFGYSGDEMGTFSLPFNTLDEGVNIGMSGGVVRIKAGTKVEPITISRPVTLYAYGGTVTVSGQ
jgi:C1A family cysteine protease